MRYIFTITFFLLFFTCAYSQQLRQVTFSGGTELSYFTFRTDQDVLIRVSPDGKILEWGSEVKSFRSDYYAPSLQPLWEELNITVPIQIRHSGARLKVLELVY